MSGEKGFLLLLILNNNYCVVFIFVCVFFLYDEIFIIFLFSSLKYVCVLFEIFIYVFKCYVFLFCL